MPHTLAFNDFEACIQKNEIVFIDFWAQWCAPCKQFASVYAQVAKQYPQVVFAKVNVETEEDFASSLQIQSIPHLMVFKQGILIYSESGSLPESVLKDLVEQALHVDVKEIRQKLDEENTRA
ncbi:MAG: thioredoxin family protein [Tatlockia sp.]|jgi:thioredoxin 1